MKCTRCKEQAIVALPNHNSAFCEPCYLDFFSRQVEKGIKASPLHKGPLFTYSDKILVALSGGKDSLALMLELSLQGYDVTGLHIDLSIGESSQKARAVVERFCSKHEFKLIIKEMEQEGLAIPIVKKLLKRPICSACGKIKRYYFNKTAKDLGFNVLATGHNLDDETARLFSNTLRWDRAYLSDQAPLLEDTEEGFGRKVKPFWRVGEFETANYAFIKGIENHHAPCPYSAGASFTTLKNLLVDLEEAMPGRKLDFYQGFLERGRPLFEEHEEKNGHELTPCSICGYPTSAGVCGVCRIKEVVRASK